jgi:hypothetical protein
LYICKNIQKYKDFNEQREVKFQTRKGEKMNYAAEITRKKGVTTLVEKLRLVLGLSMMISGLYFGLFTVGAGEGLGLLSFMVSPFVMVTDK